MRHHYAFALRAAASALLSGCAKEEQIQENIQKSITASIDGNSLTRAAVRNVNIVWTDDDAGTRLLPIAGADAVGAVRRQSMVKTARIGLPQ